MFKNGVKIWWNENNFVPLHCDSEITLIFDILRQKSAILPQNN